MIQRMLITALLRQLLGPVVRERITEMVAATADVDMTGDRKREHVIRQLRAWGYTLDTWVLNLAIELVVARQRL